MDQLKTQLEAQMLQEAVQAKVGEDAKVTDEQIKAYYDDPDNKAQFVVPDTVDARHVLVETKAKAEKVQPLLAADNSDANWKKVAKKYSIDPGTKDKGGDLGSFPKGRMVAAVREGRVQHQAGHRLGARQDAVRLARHRGHQEDPGLHEDLRGSQVDDRAVAQVPAADEGLGRRGSPTPRRPPASCTPPASTPRRSPLRRAPAARRRASPSPSATP